MGLYPQLKSHGSPAGPPSLSKMPSPGRGSRATLVGLGSGSGAACVDISGGKGPWTHTVLGCSPSSTTDKLYAKLHDLAGPRFPHLLHGLAFGLQTHPQGTTAVPEAPARVPVSPVRTFSVLHGVCEGGPIPQEAPLQRTWLSSNAHLPKTGLSGIMRDPEDVLLRAGQWCGVGGGVLKDGPGPEGRWGCGGLWLLRAEGYKLKGLQTQPPCFMMAWL